MTSARALVWRTVYELLAARVRQPEWGFMNYGFAPSGGTATLDPADEPDRLCIQLYDHVIGGQDLTGRDVLEVGSGRGGGASWVSRTSGARSTVGVDFSVRAVRLASLHRRGAGLRFVAGDALALPFPDASVDVVINVESSHCYPSMPAFLAEVRRVLRPGGTFGWADLRDAADVPGLQRDLDRCGMRILHQQDITAEVVRALEIDNARKLALMDAWVPRPLHAPFRAFAGITGTRNHRGFTSGRKRYLSARLEVPA